MTRTALLLLIAALPMLLPTMTEAAPTDVNGRDAHGFTALHRAALAGAADEVAALLAQGADPALRSTARYEHREGVLAREFDPVIVFEPGQRALDLAVFQHDRTKWATSRYLRARELLEAATPSRLGSWWRALRGG